MTEPLDAEVAVERVEAESADLDRLVEALARLLVEAEEAETQSIS